MKDRSLFRKAMWLVGNEKMAQIAEDVKNIRNKIDDVPALKEEEELQNLLED